MEPRFPNNQNIISTETNELVNSVVLINQFIAQIESFLNLSTKIDDKEKVVVASDVQKILEENNTEENIIEKLSHLIKKTWKKEKGIPLTEEATHLIEMATRGNIPLIFSSTLKNVAESNNIPIETKDSVETIIKKLENRRDGIIDEVKEIKISNEEEKSNRKEILKGEIALEKIRTPIDGNSPKLTAMKEEYDTLTKGEEPTSLPTPVVLKILEIDKDDSSKEEDKPLSTVQQLLQKFSKEKTPATIPIKTEGKIVEVSVPLKNPTVSTEKLPKNLTREESLEKLCEPFVVGEETKFYNILKKKLSENDYFNALPQRSKNFIIDSLYEKSLHISDSEKITLGTPDGIENIKKGITIHFEVLFNKKSELWRAIK